MASVELANAITDALQKTPVVGNEYDSAFEGIDLLLQPVD